MSAAEETADKMNSKMNFFTHQRIVPVFRFSWRLFPVFPLCVGGCFFEV